MDRLWFVLSILLVVVANEVRSECTPPSEGKSGPAMLKSFEAMVSHLNDATKVEKHHQLYVDTTNQLSALRSSADGVYSVYIDNYGLNETFKINKEEHCEGSDVTTELKELTSYLKWPETGQFIKADNTETKNHVVVKKYSGCVGEDTVNLYYSDATDLPIRFESMFNDTALKHAYDFPSFKAGVITDRSVFEVPLGVQCTNTFKKKNVSELVDAFTAHVETVDPISHTISHSVVAFDHDAKLSRYGSPFGTEGKPAVYIHDFTKGVEYVIDTAAQNCTMRDISGTTPDSHGANNTIDRGSQLFHLKDTALTYKGQKTWRDIRCDVWSGQENNVTMEVFFAASTFKSSVDGFGSPQTGDGNQAIFVGYWWKTKEGREAFNHVMDYLPSHPSSHWFSILPCHQSVDQMIHARVELNGTYAELVSMQHQALEEVLWKRIAALCEVSPVRIYNVYFDVLKEDDDVDVWFTILDEPHYDKTKDTVTKEAALKNLKKALKKDSSVNDQDIAQPVTIKKNSVKTDESVPDPRRPSHHKSGYSSGSMAGLAFGMLLVGVIGGCVMLLLWQRRKKNQGFAYRNDLNNYST